MTQIDLSQYPAPAVLEELEYEAVYAEIKEHFLNQFPDDEQTATKRGLPSRGNIELLLQIEGNLIVKSLQAYAYHAIQMRARVNDAAKASMLAYATESDLDNLAAFYMVSRKEGEDDEDLRARLILAVDGFSTAGPSGAYKFHGLSAADEVKDVSVDAPRFSVATVAPEIMAMLPPQSIVLQVDYDAGLSNPKPGDVAITVLSAGGAGSPSADTLDKVEVALNDEDVRPISDNPRIRAAEIEEYAIHARLWFYGNVDTEVVRLAADSAVREYADAVHRLGYDVTVSGLHRALHQPGVQRVELLNPTASIERGNNEAAFCNSITVETGGIDV